LIEVGGCILTGADENVALGFVTKSKKASVDSGLPFKDFWAAQETGSVELGSFLKGRIETQTIRDSRELGCCEPDLYFMCNG
jgi:hypothetical protein